MKRLKYISAFVSLLLIVAFIVLSMQALDVTYLTKAFYLVFTSPLLLLTLTICYTIAFFLRAIAWKLYVNHKITFKSALIALFYSLFLNHLIPVKVGDVLRVGIIKKANKRLRLVEAIESVIMMRVLDMLTLITFSAIGVYLLIGWISFQWLYVVIGVGLLLSIGGLFYYRNRRYFLFDKLKEIKEKVMTKHFLAIAFLVGLSWVFEGAVVFLVASILNESISFMESIWINSMTVGGQVFQVTPGGIATYETVMSASLAMVGVPLKEAYTIAFTSHGYKFFYSYLVGAICIIVMPISIRQIREWIRERGEQKNV
ncbi:lysylphosphatidylglycerol synthase transmembrane domain-containing protein [Metabacillus iocasae]|nr:lysylphosphatidylglycerol synthase transmembrane domain-containing protein [Metabacillus iocasae]